MADITEAIHRITYEVNDAALVKAAGAIRTQLEELTKLDKVELTQSEHRQTEIKKSVAAYQTLANTAVQSFRTIYETQLRSLDKEISLREKRVAEAKELAKRGNAQALQEEENRLNKSQELREKLAQRQLQLNAIVRASNEAVALTEAIGAVVKAASEGDPYTIAIRVAAAVASLVAGIAAIQSAFSSANSFAEGIVDFKGKGGPKEDKNWVRISAGESIITAEGTQKNRAFLEAVNKGQRFLMLNDKQVVSYPLLKQPIDSNNHSATKLELKTVEQKLDKVIDAIEGNALKQNIHFDEQGVGIMTEKAINRNRRRWS
jgi:hypothetical protein